MNDFRIYVFLMTFVVGISRTASFRTWRCINNGCVKEETTRFEESVSIGECKAKCLKYGGLWPKPRGTFNLSNRSSLVDPTNVVFESYEYPENVDALIEEAKKNFLGRIRDPRDEVDDYHKLNSVKNVRVNFEIYDPSHEFFTTNADESYKLSIRPPSENSKTINVKIEADTFFGFRHALETLGQLFFYDDIRRAYNMMDEGEIEDGPEFGHRGIVLDTARSYVGVEKILEVLDVMAMNKLNTLHWHMTDSQSFPYVSTAFPELSKTGAYSDEEVYEPNDIKKIVRRAQTLGIRVLPEFDSPAHVGEGWEALGKNLITCFKWQPWKNYCVEPPCGQFDPTKDELYEILGTLFKEFSDLFRSDLFHLGGDEVNLNCWKSTPAIVNYMKKKNYAPDDAGLLELWAEYHEKVLKKLRSVKNDPHPQAILWTSTLTEENNLMRYLRPEDYIIQIWTKKNDETIKNLIAHNFRIIFSNFDELYFDCGGPTWVGELGENWCSPYIGWQTVYQHNPYVILRKLNVTVTEEVKKLVLGSESAIWTEQIDDHNLHVRLWPRAAALAESLWSKPDKNWTDVQFRMNNHRQRMAKKVSAELLQPKWCFQNDGFCD